MEKNRRQYGFLVPVGKYDGEGTNLPGYAADSNLMLEALIKGLKFPEENIRVLGKEGRVTTQEFVRALKEFQYLLREQDTLIFYFSGHGQKKAVLLSDGAFLIQDVVNCIESLPCKNKILIFDCCYAGNFEASEIKKWNIEEELEQFVGTGIAIMGSSASDEQSFSLKEGSIFTQAVCNAFCSKNLIKRGKISLDDIIFEVRIFMQKWNERYPEQRQHVICRSSIGGIIFFRVEEEIQEKVSKLIYAGENYEISNIKSIGTISEKRLCVFICLNKEISEEKSIEFTKRIVKQVRYLKISEKEKKQFFRKSADAIWCYFAKDEHDLLYSSYYQYTIWGKTKKERQKYFRKDRNAKVRNEIYIWKNPDYELIRKIQLQEESYEICERESKELLQKILLKAQEFVRVMEEVQNQKISIAEVKEEYQEWIEEIRKLYLKLSDQPIPPDELYDWIQDVFSLAGWILDIAIVLKKEKIDSGDSWLLKNAIKNYYEELEKLKKYRKSEESYSS